MPMSAMPEWGQGERAYTLISWLDEKPVGSSNTLHPSVRAPTTLATHRLHLPSRHISLAFSPLQVPPPPPPPPLAPQLPSFSPSQPTATPLPSQLAARNVALATHSSQRRPCNSQPATLPLQVAPLQLPTTWPYGCRNSQLLLALAFELLLQLTSTPSCCCNSYVAATYLNSELLRELTCCCSPWC